MAKDCTECLHYHACRGTYYSAKGDGTLLYDFEGEMYGDSGCEHYEPKSKYAEIVHGKWEYIGGDVGYSQVKCSACGKMTVFGDEEEISLYCHKCGAKMDGGELGD